MDRIGELELIDRVCGLDERQSAELARLIAREKLLTWRRNRYQIHEKEHRRSRYANDPEYRAKVLEKNERWRLRKAGRL